MVLSINSYTLLKTSSDNFLQNTIHQKLLALLGPCIS